MGFFRQIGFNLFTLVILGIIGTLVVQNFETETTLILGSNRDLNISTGLVILLSFVAGAFGVFFRLWNTVCNKQSDIKRFELRKEKAEVRAETSTDQVRSLEAKIKTLEKALEQALSSSSSTTKNR